MFTIKCYKDEGKKQEDIYGTAQRCCDAIKTATDLFTEGNAVVEVVASGNRLVYRVYKTLESGAFIKKILDNRENTPGCA